MLLGPFLADKVDELQDPEGWEVTAADLRGPDSFPSLERMVLPSESLAAARRAAEAVGRKDVGWKRRLFVAAN